MLSNFSPRGLFLDTVQVSISFQKIARLVGRLGTGPLLVGQIGLGPHLVDQIGSGVRVFDSFHILSCAVVRAISF